MTARRHIRVTVGNLKGGTGKTTTAVFLATTLARAGDRVLLVDADPQGSAMDWSEQTDQLPTVIPWPTRDLARRVADVSGDFDHVVIDTAPGHGLILRQALLATDELIVPVAPSPMELRRLGPTFELAAEVDASGHPVLARVLLVRVRARTRSAAAARAALRELGLPVMAAEIPHREAYALAWGSNPGAPGRGAYAEVLDELLDQRAAADA